MRSIGAPQGECKRLAQGAVESIDFEGQLVILLDG
jgi:hypothetical protein